MDFFVGTCWVHRAADGTTKIVRMLPGAANTRSQPTMIDVNGMTSILAATDDGRVFIYPTRKPYRPERIQWATIGGDLNHTACWHEPAVK